jgi:DNA-binding transcriptional regulator YdaS (Cro superfamily)
MNTRELIEAVGGIRAAARLLGVVPSTVHHYCKTDRISHWRLLVLISAIEHASKGKLTRKQVMKEYVLERQR